jgi:hypothetical protein
MNLVERKRGLQIGLVKDCLNELVALQFAFLVSGALFWVLALVLHTYCSF